MNNTSGCTGVDLNSGRWRARYSINNKTYIIGKYDTKEEAIAARKAVEFTMSKIILDT